MLRTFPPVFWMSPIPLGKPVWVFLKGLLEWTFRALFRTRIPTKRKEFFGISIRNDHLWFPLIQPNNQLVPVVTSCQQKFRLPSPEVIEVWVVNRRLWHLSWANSAVEMAFSDQFPGMSGPGKLIFYGPMGHGWLSTSTFGKGVRLCCAPSSDSFRYHYILSCPHPYHGCLTISVLRLSVLRLTKVRSCACKC